MRKQFLSLTFFQVIFLAWFEIVITNGQEVQEQPLDVSNQWVGRSLPDLRGLLPVTTVQQAGEDLETAPARNAMRVIPGPVFQHEANDHIGEETMFFPKKESAYKLSSGHEYDEPKRSKSQIVTKWGNSDGSQDSHGFNDDGDNERASNDPVYYAYEYKVHDPLTGDVKGHKEFRDGDRVKGYYMLHDADGSMREVHYTADHDVGFTAVVSKTDDVAPPHKPKPVQDDVFNHNPKPPTNSFSFKENKDQSQLNQHHHETVNDRPAAQSFFAHSFHNPRDAPHKLFNSDNNERDENTLSRPQFKYENDDEARNLERFHPTPSYEEAYNSFAKKQPMPSLQADWHTHSKNEGDEGIEDDDVGDDDEDFRQFVPNTQNHYNRPYIPDSQYHPFTFHASGHRSARMKSAEKAKDFKRAKGIRISHKNSAHSFQYRDAQPAGEMYEDERDYENDESRATYSIAPSSSSFENRHSNLRPLINSTMLLTSLLPSQPALTEESSKTFINKVPFKGEFNSPIDPVGNNNFGRFGENIGEVKNDFSLHSKRNSKPNSETNYNDFGGKYNFGNPSNVESGFRPIPNPFSSSTSYNTRYNSGPYKNLTPQKDTFFKQTSSLYPDNSRFRSFKNNSFSSFATNPHFENSRPQKYKFKNGFFDEEAFEKWPHSSTNENKWGKTHFKGEYFDDFNADNPRQHYNKNFEYDGSDHSVPKRETIKYRMKHQGYPRKGAVRRANKKPKITSIYDVMAYGGLDWPKKIRHSSNDKKKSRQAYRGFSNRRYNEGKKKRSVLPYEGYFPDRNNVEKHANKQAPLDYEYINTFSNK